MEDGPERARQLGIRSYSHTKGGVSAAVQVRPDEVELVRRDYSANGGWETFLAYEDPRQDILVGLLRLRKVRETVRAVCAAPACRFCCCASRGSCCYGDGGIEQPSAVVVGVGVRG